MLISKIQKYNSIASYQLPYDLECDIWNTYKFYLAVQINLNENLLAFKEILWCIKDGCWHMKIPRWIFTAPTSEVGKSLIILHLPNFSRHHHFHHKLWIIIYLIPEMTNNKWPHRTIWGPFYPIWEPHIWSYGHIWPFGDLTGLFGDRNGPFWDHTGPFEDPTGPFGDLAGRPY